MTHPRYTRCPSLGLNVSLETEGAGKVGASTRHLAHETKEPTGNSPQVRLCLSDKAGRFEDSFFHISVGLASIESLTCSHMFTNITMTAGVGKTAKLKIRL
jgi:hypothetical protein